MDLVNWSGLIWRTVRLIPRGPMKRCNSAVVKLWIWLLYRSTVRSFLLIPVCNGLMISFPDYQYISLLLHRYQVSLAQLRERHLGEAFDGVDVEMPVFTEEEIAAENRSYLHWANDEASSDAAEASSSEEEEGAQSSSDGSESEYHPSGTGSQPSDEVLSAVLSADEVEHLTKEAANLSMEEAAIPAMDGPEVPMEVDTSIEEVSGDAPDEAVAASAVPLAVPSKRVEVVILKKPSVPRVGILREPKVREFPSFFASCLLKFFQRSCDACERKGEVCSAPTDGSACLSCRRAKGKCSLSDSRRGRRSELPSRVSLSCTNS